MVEAARGSAYVEIANVIDKLGNPPALTLEQLMEKAPGLEWLHNLANRRSVGHRLEENQYVRISNRAAKDGLWKIKGDRQAIYARTELTTGQREDAAEALRDQLNAAK
jgi:hypothetical protein